MIKAVLYLRSSKDRSDVSIDAQRRQLHELAMARGLTIVDEFADAVFSGKDDDRPGFPATLARCRQLGAVLVAARLDWSTHRAHLSGLLEEGYQVRAADMPGADA